MAFDRGRPKGPQLPFRATFVDDDGRYARVNGTIYPALLVSCRRASRYLEDMRDSDDYPAAWCRQFGHDLIGRAAAVLVCDADDHRWTFLGLFQVDEVHVTNFLACKIGAKLTNLQLQPATR